MFIKSAAYCITRARTLGYWCIACVLVQGCIAAPQLLNSERIAAKFGSYRVEVLAQDDRMRISSLASEEGDQLITRTLAIVTFEPAAEPYAAVHQQILGGGSIGSTFRDAGWRISKPASYIGSVRVSAEASIVADMMDIGIPADLAAHVYRFEVSKNGHTYTYATLIELHHPAYLTATELQGIYGDSPDSGNYDVGVSLARSVRDALSALPESRL